MEGKVEFRKVKILDPNKTNKSFQSTQKEEPKFSPIISIIQFINSILEKIKSNGTNLIKNYYFSIFVITIVGLICLLFLLEFFE